MIPSLSALRSACSAVQSTVRVDCPHPLEALVPAFRKHRALVAGRGCYLKPLMRAPMASPIRVGKTAFIAIIA
jgi:hypothetical protein